MVDKLKTIEKARKKYHEIYPVAGKKWLGECFVSLHGEVLLKFRTKDKKLHTMKAPQIKQPYLFLTQFQVDKELLSNLRRVLTKPVYITNLIMTPKR